MGLPQFQPPPGHMRSYNKPTASDKREALLRGLHSAGTSERACMANAVGSTQLLVRGVHPHPRKESSCMFTALEERMAESMRLHNALSRGKSSQSHFSPAWIDF